jgi:N-acetylneuraminic acid mutarotase
MDEQCQQPPRFKRPSQEGMQMPDTATWTARTFLNVARGGLANATAGGRIHAIGGWTSDFATPLASVEAHQPGTGAWQLVAPMLTPRGNLGAAAVGNRIYAFGGFDTPDTGTDLAERFDRSANQWEQIRRLPVATIGPGVAALGGRIFVVGGGTNDATVTSVHVYNPQTDTFSEAAPMPTARQLLKATELGGRLYAIGGVNDTGFLATVERYTPATDTWETVTPMSTPRGNPGMVSAAGRIFVVGGASDVSGSVVPLQSSEVFDPNTNTWQPVDALLPVGRGSLSAERGPGNVILAFGGFESGVTASTRVEALPISQL